MQSIVLLNAEIFSENSMLQQKFPLARDIPLNGRKSHPGPNAMQQQLQSELAVASLKLQMKLEQKATTFLAFSPAIDVSVLRQVRTADLHALSRSARTGHLLLFDGMRQYVFMFLTGC